jgi:hypothetical protein
VKTFCAIAFLVILFVAVMSAAMVLYVRNEHPDRRNYK